MVRLSSSRHRKLRAALIRIQSKALRTTKKKKK